MVPDDDALRVMMRLTAQAVGLNLSEERIEADLPGFRTYLQSAQVLFDYPIPIEVEQAHTFRLSRRGEP